MYIKIKITLYKVERLDKFYYNFIWEDIKGIYYWWKNDQKEAQHLKQIFNHYVNKRKEILNSTKFKVEYMFGDVISKDSISPEQITKLKNFLAKIMWI